MSKTINFKLNEKMNIDKLTYLNMIDLSEITNYNVSELDSYLTLSLVNNGENKVSYGYGKGKKYGRNFSKGTSLQGICGEVRKFLTSDIYNDFDIVNCQPSILKYVINKYYPNKSFPSLIQYLKERDTLLTDKIDKQYVISVMNNQNYKNINNNDFFSALFNEFEIIRNLVWESPPLDHVKKPNKKEDNYKGSFLSNIIQEFENIHLMESIKKLNSSKIGSLMFDGFYYDINEPVQPILQKLNNNKYGLKWIVKSNKSKIIMDNSKVNKKPKQTYEIVKREFEKKYFMIQNPILYGWEHEVQGKKVLATYCLSDFKTLTASYQFLKLNKFGEAEYVNFLNEWIKDENIRKYKAVDNIPFPIGTDITQDSEIYNEFSGFDTELITKQEYEELNGDKYVKILAEHIKLLTDYHEESFIYLANYLAHLFQYPNELPLIAILFKSEEGVGKDSLIEIIEKIFGSTYFHRAEDASSLFGDKNGDSRKGKLVIQLNELKATDGKKYESDIKGLITTVQNNVRELYKNAYKQKNNARVIASVNTENPFKVSSSDRRWVVFRCGSKKDEQYYDTLYREVVNNPNALKCIAYSFMTMDINGFNIKNRPLTEAYKEMKSHSCNPLFKFLHDLFYTEEYKAISTVHKKTPSDIRIESKDLLLTYQDYLKRNNLDEVININSRTLTSTLQSQSIKKKRVKINGMTKEPFIFDLNTILPKLKKITDLDDDDIEDESPDDIIGFDLDQGFIN
jgi:hypothetical protein